MMTGSVNVSRSIQTAQANKCRTRASSLLVLLLQGQQTNCETSDNLEYKFSPTLSFLIKIHFVAE